MLLRLRVEVADRPGSLGRLTTVLGVLGADIAQIVVLEREAGWALDDVVVEWSSARPSDPLLAAVHGVPGVRVVGLWGPSAAPEAWPEVDLVSQMVLAPARALVTLMDAAPALLAADYAWISHTQDGVLAATWGAPEQLQAPGTVPTRVMAVAEQPATVRGPLPDGLVLSVLRREGASFHRSELYRLRRVLDVLDGLRGVETRHLSAYAL